MIPAQRHLSSISPGPEYCRAHSPTSPTGCVSACRVRTRTGCGSTPHWHHGSINMTEDEINARHKKRMERLKVARDKIQARKTEERGLLIVNTGNGRGKATAGVCMELRSPGGGTQVDTHRTPQ